MSDFCDLGLSFVVAFAISVTAGLSLGATCDWDLRLSLVVIAAISTNWS